jgi:hypothetical protein
MSYMPAKLIGGLPDHFNDVMGCGGFPSIGSIPGTLSGGFLVARVAAQKVTSHRVVLSVQPPRVVFLPISFESFEGLYQAADELLKRLQGFVRQASVTCGSGVVLHSLSSCIYRNHATGTLQASALP